jgi:DNA-binding CsgD family transcriptional regulator
VVDRRTNPEITAEAFLSIKTVESHLRNIGSPQARCQLPE